MHACTPYYYIRLIRWCRQMDFCSATYLKGFQTTTSTRLPPYVGNQAITCALAIRNLITYEYEPTNMHGWISNVGVPCTSSHNSCRGVLSVEKTL